MPFFFFFYNESMKMDKEMKEMKEIKKKRKKEENTLYTEPDFISVEVSWVSGAVVRSLSQCPDAGE